MSDSRSRELLEGPISVVHVGVDAVVEGPVAAGATVTRTTFAPPCAGSPDRLANLERFHVPAWVEAVHEANEVALQRFLASEPHLVDVAVARDVIPGMADDLFLLGDRLTLSAAVRTDVALSRFSPSEASGGGPGDPSVDVLPSPRLGARLRLADSSAAQRDPRVDVLVEVEIDDR